MTRTWLPSEMALLFTTVRNLHITFRQGGRQGCSKPSGNQRVRGGAATQPKKEPLPGLQPATWARGSLKLLRSRDWPDWRYLERKNHDRSSVRTGCADWMAPIWVRELGTTVTSIPPAIWLSDKSDSSSCPVAKPAGFKSPGGGKNVWRRQVKPPPNFKPEDFSLRHTQDHLRCSHHL